MTNPNRSEAAKSSQEAPGGGGSSTPPALEFPVVGVAASAGGLEAFKAFLGAVPDDPGMAFVLIQHLDPTHDSMLSELLARGTSLSVIEAEDGQQVEQNHVYVIPPNRRLSISDGQLILEKPDSPEDTRMAADYFFKSLAADCGLRAIGVVLSGTGSGGAAGLKSIKAEGGMAIAQEPGEAQHDGMPRAAIETGVVDMVLPVAEMPEVLMGYGEHPYLKPEQSAAEEGEDDHLTNILSVLRTRRGLDFRPYKKPTLKRRIKRRMGLNRVPSMHEYLGHLREDEREVERLGRDLMIGVTSFFRDPDAFAELESKVIEPLVRNADEEDGLRIWVPACSSGEEPYTVAMLVREQLERQGRSLPTHIFASDIDISSIEKARKGYFPVGATVDLGEDRLKHYFEFSDHGRLRVNKAVREMVVFANQNLLSDPPFSRLDLICCRNLMIYLKPPVQKQLIRLFHFALRPGGYLMLGTSESVNNHPELFETINKRMKIFQRRHDSVQQAADLPWRPKRKDTRNIHLPGVQPEDKEDRKRPDLDRLAANWILDLAAPASILINRRHEALYFSGDVEHYLRLPKGEAQMQLLEMLREGLSARVRTAVHRAFEQNRQVVVSPVQMISGERRRAVRLEVNPIRDEAAGDGLALVSLSDCPPMEDQPVIEATGEGDNELVQHLENELQSTRNNLQSTIEELETSNEELQASNEEVMSVNEELQSANEELETSKEELQSLNEELSTVNSELEDKVTELENANDDILNLLKSSDIGTLFLNRRLEIKRFTPALQDLFRLRDTDTGRSVEDISRRVNDPDLTDDATQVLKKLTPVERTVSSDEDRWYVRRITPYRTEDDVIEGVVVTYAEVSHLRQAERAATSRLAQLEAIYQNVPVGLAFHDRDSRVIRMNQSLAKINGIEVEDSIGRRASELLPPPLGGRVEELIEKVFTEGQPIIERALRGQTAAEPDTTREWRVAYYPVNTDNGERIGVNAMVQEVTSQRQAERRLRAAGQIAMVMADQHDPESLKDRVTSALTESMEMVIGEYWEPHDESSDSLRCTHFKTPDSPDDEDAFQHLFDKGLQQTGEALVGQVWQLAEPVWVDDVTQLEEFSRSGVADRLGLTSAFAFPVLDRGRVKAVMACYARQRLPGDDDMQVFLSQVGQDIGHGLRRTRAEQQLLDASRRKTEFLSILGHELRNPLAALSASIELIKGGSDRSEWALGIVEDNIQVMTRLLDDLLDLNRIDQGRIQLQRETWDIGKLVGNAVDSMRSSYEEKSIRLEIVCPADEILAHVDRTRFNQILINLLSNARKFSDPGTEVIVTVDCPDETVTVSVADTGRGLAAEDLQRIFQPFEQITPDETNQGLGIGLALVRQLVDMHEGEITVNSSGLGQGATFTVVLPLMDIRAAQPRSTQTDRRDLPADVRVLFVDDNREVSETMTEITCDWGCQAEFALTAEAALEAIESFSPDVCVIDIGLPDMSGHDLAATIRKRHQNKHYLVALTGYGHQESSRDAKAAGFDLHMTKPPNYAHLRQVLIGAFNQPEDS